MPFILCIFTLFIACGRSDNEAHFVGTPSVRIKDKLALYCEKSRAEFLAKRWAVDECDGLLFTSLRGVACGDVSITDFEDSVEPGKWYRDPKHSCYLAEVEGEQGSDSSISKDMMVGLTIYATAQKTEENKNILGRTIAYGKQHDWIVGEAKDNATLLSKCFITPTLQTLLRDALNYEGGSLTDIPPSSSDSIGVSTGFRAHLDVLAILARGKIDGHISDLDLKTLKDQAKQQPHNALFLSAKARYDDGDFSAAETILLDETKFPADHLPTNENYCTSYLWQRDESPEDWGPCLAPQTFDGTDFVFAAAITLGNF